jgi:hypothetical protein
MQLILQNLSDALRDINEHRLSKFEFALLLVKIQEQLLEDDIQYNFVEHLYTGTQVRYSIFCRSVRCICHSRRGQQLARIHNAAKSANFNPPACTITSPNLELDTTSRHPQVPIEADILPLPSSIGSESPDAIADLRPKLPENLVKEFGHDGIGEFNPAEYTGEDKRAADLDEQLKYLDKPKMM